MRSTESSTVEQSQPPADQVGCETHRRHTVQLAAESGGLADVVDDNILDIVSSLGSGHTKKLQWNLNVKLSRQKMELINTKLAEIVT